jgi:hypothetical protein
LQHYFPWQEATQMNYQTKYLEDNVTKKEYPNFPKAICLFLFTQIGFAQFTIPENQLYRLLFMIMQMCFSATEKHN